MNDKYIDHDMPYINRNDIPPRFNRDNVIDSQIDLCISTDFITSNGRLLSDKNIGSFTYCSIQGESTVDYFLVCLEDLSTLIDF
jgi:hypothetical protein